MHFKTLYTPCHITALSCLTARGVTRACLIHKLENSKFTGSSRSSRMSCPSLCDSSSVWRVQFNIELNLYEKHTACVCVCVCGVWRDCANGISSNKRLRWWWGMVNGPSERAELTGLAQPLWTRLSLRLHGSLLPNTQMDDDGRRVRWKKGGKVSRSDVGWRNGEGWHKEAGDAKD